MTDEPMLRIERGNPSDEELAAVIAVVATRLSGTGAAVPPKPRRSEWANPGRAVRRSHRPGPGGWRAAAFPR